MRNFGLQFIWICLVAFPTFACSDEAAGPPVGTEIVLPVRVHVLTSSSGSLNAALSDDEVRQLVAGSNEVWQQANVVWQIESILSAPALNAAAFEQELNAGTGFSTGVLESILPPDQVLSDGWNVYYIGDFGGSIGGVFLISSGVVIVAEVAPSGERDLTVDGPRILAHELGHSLTLPHVPCTPEGNLMAPGCVSQDRTRLADTQISAARTQAATGRPFGQ